ncbi:MAG TPA: LysR family transcriptional regulator [Stellaceae bacterium]|nr:LysR family transcriptional regulator [Stellaceae bacterium]
MDIRQIELFIAAAEEQNFTRAARREHIVQSGLSVAIRALENELGAQLFARSTRRVQLSEAGRRFLPEARRVLLAVKAARDAVAALKGGLVGRLAIGAVQSLHPLLDLPALLQAFRKRYPMVEIVVRGNTFTDVLGQALRDGSLDLAFMPVSEVLPTGLAHDVLFSEPMVVVASADHAIGRRREITLPELASEEFVDFSPRMGTRYVVDQMFLLEGVTRRIGFEVENLELLFQFVRHGLGLAIVPRAIATGRDLAAVNLTPASGQPLPRWELGLFRVNIGGQLSANPAADTFRAMVEEALNRAPHSRSPEEPRRHCAPRRVGDQAVDDPGSP